MGEIADMMLDGTLCEGCGAYIDDDPPGYPRYCCDACARDRGALDEAPAQKNHRKMRRVLRSAPK